MNLLGGDHPFYKPLWRRIAVVAAVAAWALYEALYVREPLWLTIACGVFAFAAWEFLINWPPKAPSDGEKH